MGRMEQLMEEVEEVFKGTGMSESGKKALLGNISKETGGTFDPTQAQLPKGPGLGLFQMEGPMQNSLKDFCATKNLDPASTFAQLSFLKSAVFEPGSLPNKHIGAGNASKIQKGLTGNSDKEASDSFCKHFLKPKDQGPAELGQRESLGKKHYEVMNKDNKGKKGCSSTTATPTGGSNVDYTIKAGDNLSKIAAEHGTTTDVLVKLNNIKDPDVIYAGAKLKLPSDQSTPAKVPSNTDTQTVPSSSSSAAMKELAAGAGLAAATGGVLSGGAALLNGEDADIVVEETAKGAAMGATNYVAQKGVEKIVTQVAPTLAGPAAASTAGAAIGGIVCTGQILTNEKLSGGEKAARVTGTVAVTAHGAVMTGALCAASGPFAPLTAIGCGLFYGVFYKALAE